MQLQQEQGHGHREDAIAQGSQPFDALPGDSVVARGHSLDSLFAWRSDSRLPRLSGSTVLPTKRRCEASLSVFRLLPEKKKGAERAAPFLVVGCWCDYRFNSGDAFCSREIRRCAASGAWYLDSVMISEAEASLP